MMELFLSRHESDGNQGVEWEGGAVEVGKAFKTPCLYSVEHLCQCHSLSASLTLFLFFFFKLLSWKRGNRHGDNLELGQW